MDFMSAITGLMVPFVIAAFTWLSKLSASVTELRVMVAKDYVQNKDLEDAMDPLSREMKHMRRMLEAITRNMHIPAIREED